MTQVPTKIVVDCSQSPRPAPEVVAELRERVAVLLADGKVDEAQALARKVVARPQPSAGVVVPLTAEEIAQLELDRAEGDVHAVSFRRAQRNALLSQSDWTQLPDVILDEKQARAWADYRQALRGHDCTADNPFPEPPA